MKTIYYSQQKLNAKIIDHFENQGVFEYSESKYNSKEIKEIFQIEFKDSDYYRTGKYSFLITYDLNKINIIDFDPKLTMVYSLNKEGQEEVKFKLKLDNTNPPHPGLHDIMMKIKDKQDRADYENEKNINYDY
jgi:hypothetical protein